MLIKKLVDRNLVFLEKKYYSISAKETKLSGKKNGNFVQHYLENYSDHRI